MSSNVCDLIDQANDKTLLFVPFDVKDMVAHIYGRWMREG